MKKILTIIILTLLSSNISYSKDNPLKIFKKEILGEEAKKKMSLAYDSLTRHNKILKYNEEEKAIEITLDYSMEGHPEDWNLSDDQAQRWEFVTKKKNYHKLGKEVYLKYIFKLNAGQNHSANIWQVVGTKKGGEIIYPSMQIRYTTDEDDLPNRVQFYYKQIEEVFWTDIDPSANRFKSTTYKFDLGSLNAFNKRYQTALFKIKPSKKDDGEFIMWLNGERVIEFYGPNMILDKTGGIAFKIGLYRYWNAKLDSKKIEPSTLSIKEYVISKDCEKIMDKDKCKYKSKDNVPKTKYKYRVQERHYIPEGAKKIKRIISKVIPKKINFKEMKGNFLAIIKNKKDDKYLLKYLGYSKEGASKEGISKCIENFSNFTEIDNNGCYLHYSSQVGFGQ
jgi:hypothetical protein